MQGILDCQFGAMVLLKVFFQISSKESVNQK